MNELTLWAFLTPEGEIWRGRSYNNASIRVYTSEKRALAHLNRYGTEKDKETLQLVTFHPNSVIHKINVLLSRELKDADERIKALAARLEKYEGDNHAGN